MGICQSSKETATRKEPKKRPLVVSTGRAPQLVCAATTTAAATNFVVNSTGAHQARRNGARYAQRGVMNNQRQCSAAVDDSPLVTEIVTTNYFNGGGGEDGVVAKSLYCNEASGSHGIVNTKAQPASNLADEPKLLTYVVTNSSPEMIDTATTATTRTTSSASTATRNSCSHHSITTTSDGATRSITRVSSGSRSASSVNPAAEDVGASRSSSSASHSSRERQQLLLLPPPPPLQQQKEGEAMMAIPSHVFDAGEIETTHMERKRLLPTTTAMALREIPVNRAMATTKATTAAATKPTQDGNPSSNKSQAEVDDEDDIDDVNDVTISFIGYSAANNRTAAAAVTDKNTSKPTTRKHIVARNSGVNHPRSQKVEVPPAAMTTPTAMRSYSAIVCDDDSSFETSFSLSPPR